MLEEEKERKTSRHGADKSLLSDHWPEAAFCLVLYDYSFVHMTVHCI
jgi:hypothetical protein